MPGPVARALRAAADLVWPPRSLLSDARVAMPGTIEPDLWQALPFLFGTACERCGLPLPDAPAPVAECAACIADPPPWSRAAAALAYDDLSRPLVLALKHAGRRDGLGAFASWMAEAAPFAREADVALGVPLHWTRLWRRGFNQSHWLAQAIGRRCGVPVEPAALVRIKRTPSQKGLSRAGRARNMQGAFTVRPDARARLNNRRVLLVDDVLTTGATLSACARTLLRAGAAHVDVVTLARVVRPRQVD